MEISKLYFNQCKSTGEVQEYDTGKYVLKLDLPDATFSMYAIDGGQFLVQYNNCYATSRYLDSRLNKILQLDAHDEDKEELSNTLISGYFYEAICRAGLPVSFLTDNISIIRDFIQKFLQQWNVSLPYEFNLIIPKIEEYLEGTCIKGTCFLQGSSGNYEIGLSIYNDIFIYDGIKTYYLIQPDIFKRYQLGNNPRIDAIEKALYWTILANLHFEVGYGDDIFCHQNGFKGFEKYEEYYPELDWEYGEPNEWFKTPNTIRQLLKADNVEDVLLTTKNLKETYSKRKRFSYIRDLL